MKKNLQAIRKVNFTDQKTAVIVGCIIKESFRYISLITKVQICTEREFPFSKDIYVCMNVHTSSMEWKSMIYKAISSRLNNYQKSQAIMYAVIENRLFLNSLPQKLVAAAPGKGC